MAKREEAKFDHIGGWSKRKLEIVEKYARAYSTILSAKKRSWAHHIYIDAFAGYGLNVLRDTGETEPGSPINALLIEPPFKECHFIEIKPDKLRTLKEVVARSVRGSTRNVYLYEGDCNEVLQKEIFTKIRADSRVRALCFLDPKGIHFHWDTVCAAAETRRVDLFLNFSISDANRNMFVKDLAKLEPWQISRARAFWGDETWVDTATSGSLYKDLGLKTANNEDITAAYGRRLSEIAGFEYVPEPLGVRNDQGVIIYYLFFASHVEVAGKIVGDIFRKAKAEINNVQPFRHRVDRNDVEPGNGLF